MGVKVAVCLASVQIVVDNVTLRAGQLASQPLHAEATETVEKKTELYWSLKETLLTDEARGAKGWQVLSTISKAIRPHLLAAGPRRITKIYCRSRRRLQAASTFPFVLRRALTQDWRSNPRPISWDSVSSETSSCRPIAPPRDYTPLVLSERSLPPKSLRKP